MDGIIAGLDVALSDRGAAKPIAGLFGSGDGPINQTHGNDNPEKDSPHHEKVREQGELGGNGASGTGPLAITAKGIARDPAPEFEWIVDLERKSRNGEHPTKTERDYVHPLFDPPASVFPPTVTNGQEVIQRDRAIVEDTGKTRSRG